MSTQHAESFEEQGILRGDSWFLSHCSNYLLVLVSILKAVRPSRSRFLIEEYYFRGDIPSDNRFSESRASWVCDFDGS